MRHEALLTLFIILCLSPAAVSANQGSIPLLALIQENGTEVGDTATLTLDVRDGANRVFLDTFPLTKIGTQISMRFAQQYVCQSYDCSGLDFIYQIHSTPGIVGGPSAGAAAAILTKSLLEGDELDARTVVTGTINPGGLVGAVGGVKQKLEGAAKEGYTRALIPRGMRHMRADNVTLDLIEYGSQLGLEVIEVNSFDEAYAIFTGNSYQPPSTHVQADQDYQEIMRHVALLLCSRSARVAKTIDTTLFARDLDNATNESQSTRTYEQAMNFSKTSKDLFSAQQYYSAASFCFRSNVLYQHIAFAQQEPSTEQITERIANISRAVDELESQLETKEINTISDLQTYMIVRDRILEAKEGLQRINSSNLTSLVPRVEERILSVQGWLSLFEREGTAFDITNATLEASCRDKIKEAEERYNYGVSTFPSRFSGVRESIDLAYESLAKNEFAICLYQASFAKAEVDMVTSASGVISENDVRELILHRLQVVAGALNRAQEKGTFPIIGYIYYEYSKALLKQGDLYSSLLYSSYALEMSNVDLYFSSTDKHKVLLIDQKSLGIALIAFAAGLLIGGLFVAYATRRR